MSQYFPCYKATFPIDRKLTPLEYKIVVSHAQKLEFKNGFIQDRESSSCEFVPNFSDHLNLENL